MAYTSGFLKNRVTILNRKEATQGKFGLDSAGIEWVDAGTVWASVDWTRGKQAMNAGALDAYAVVIVRMRWNDIITMRSRIIYDEQTYQIIPETFHRDYQENTIQFQAQLVINE